MGYILNSNNGWTSISNFTDYTEITLEQYLSSLKINKMNKKFIYKLKPGFEKYKSHAENIAGYNSRGYLHKEYSLEHCLLPGSTFLSNIEEAGVLDIWFDKIEIKEKKIIKVNDIFSVTLEDNKIYHKEDDITKFVENITSNFKYYIIGDSNNCASLNGYDVRLKDIIFSQTGCEHNETTLSQWINVWDKYLEFNK